MFAYCYLLKLILVFPVAMVNRPALTVPVASSSKQAKAFRITSSGSVPFSFSPNMVRNMVKLMGPGASLIMPSKYSSVGFFPERFSQRELDFCLNGLVCPLAKAVVTALCSYERIETQKLNLEWGNLIRVTSGRVLPYQANCFPQWPNLRCPKEGYKGKRLPRHPPSYWFLAT